MQRVLLEEHERLRLLQMCVYEQKLRDQGIRLIAGIDEAGRGPLAGPVVAAACILPPDRFISGLNDSKKLTAARREAIYSEICSDAEIRFAIGIVNAARIDEINILQATFEAMKEAVRALALVPEYLLIDGNRIPRFSLPALAIVRGDALSVSIAAASIAAKVTRDRLMVEAAAQWPQYGFEKHKGYGTPQHLEALRLYGPCPIHRSSFIL